MGYSDMLHILPKMANLFFNCVSVDHLLNHATTATTKYVTNVVVTINGIMQIILEMSEVPALP